MNKRKQYISDSISELATEQEKGKKSTYRFFLPFTFLEREDYFFLKHAIHRLLCSIHPHTNFTTVSSV